MYNSQKSSFYGGWVLLPVRAIFHCIVSYCSLRVLLLSVRSRITRLARMLWLGCVQVLSALPQVHRGFDDGFIIWLILGDVKLHASVEAFIR